MKVDFSDCGPYLGEQIHIYSKISPPAAHEICPKDGVFTVVIDTIGKAIVSMLWFLLQP